MPPVSRPAVPLAERRKMGGVRANDGHAEAIQLVRSLPPSAAVAVSARPTFLRVMRRWQRFWAEVRGSAILLYPLPEGVSNVDAGEAERVVRETPMQHVVLCPLREARLRVKASNFTMLVSKPGGRGGVQVRFDGEDSYTEWSELVGNGMAKREVRLADFEIVRYVGKGASGRVYLVKNKETKEQQALKVIDKSTVYESGDSYRHVLDERLILEMVCAHPFILGMRSAFQNTKRLFLVTEFCAGGDMFEYMNRRCTPMTEEITRAIASELLLAIEHIHSLGVVYRDLKLENVLLDGDGHVRLADFGLSKRLCHDGGEMRRTSTFCGTREYVAPEMIAGTQYDTSVDIWAFGILLYEMLCGRTPFYSKEGSEIYDRISQAPIYYPQELSGEVQDLLSRLLNRNTDARLGMGASGISAIKAHPWFADVDWTAVYSMSNDSPIKKEIFNMRRGATSPAGVTSAASGSPKKTKRQVLQEKAMQQLKADLAADVAQATAAQQLQVQGNADAASGSPRSPSSARVSGAGGISPRQRIPLAMAARTAPIVAGYTFYGTLPRMCAPQKLKSESVDPSPTSIAQPETASTNGCDSVATESSSSASQERSSGSMSQGGASGVAISISGSDRNCPEVGIADGADDGSATAATSSSSEGSSARRRSSPSRSSAARRMPPKQRSKEKQRRALSLDTGDTAATAGHVSSNKEESVSPRSILHV